MRMLKLALCVPLACAWLCVPVAPGFSGAAQAQQAKPAPAQGPQAPARVSQNQNPNAGSNTGPSAGPNTGSSTGQTVGQVTGLPIPRYVSLKSDRVNLREGPSKEHRTSWVFQRAGMPVEITAEFETWRRVRDSDGAEGWVLHSLLSGRRTALIMPLTKGKTDPVPLMERADERASTVARLQPNVISTVKSCTGNWCRVVVDSIDGYIRQDRLWGIYPNERVE